MSLSPKRCHNKIGWPRRWPFVCTGGDHVRNLRKQYLAAVLRVHVCLAHSSSHAVISSHSMGIGRSMEGHFQAEFEGTAPVTVCKPCSKCHKCPSGEVQDAYFIAQRIHKMSHTKLSSTKFGVDSFEQGDRIANAMCDCDVPQVLPTLFPRDHC